MNRRGFISFLIAAPVTKALPWNGIAKFLTPVVPIVAQEIRWSLTEIIQAAIRARAPELARNIQANNALLRRLQGK